MSDVKAKIREAIGEGKRFALVYVEPGQDATQEQLVCIGSDDDEEDSTLLLESYVAQFNGETYDKTE